jgi:VWFA-related protein
MTRSRSVAAILVLVSTSWPAAQERQSQPPSFRAGVELVMVDVGVLDRQGQPVRGLGPNDFTVTVGGVARRVVSAEFVDSAAAVPGAATEPVVPVSTNEGAGAGRLVLFVLDQATLDPASGRYVVAGASRLFARLTPSDRSALVALPVGQTVPFTWAHDRVRQALQQATGLGGRTTSFDYGSLAEARDIANRNTSTLQMVWERECGAMANAGAQGTGTTTPGGIPGGGGTGTGAGTGSAGRGATPPGSVGSALGFDACSRTLQMQAESAWREVESTSQATLGALRQMLEDMSRIQGDKAIILISGGWPLSEHEEMSAISNLASEAAAARATFFTLFVPHTAVAVDRRQMSTTVTRDQLIQSGPLEMAASMTGGSYYRADVGAEGVFDRIAREMGGFYRLGVQRESADTDGKQRKMKIQVARPGTAIRARDTFDARTFEDRDWAARLGNALDAPLPATGIGLRVTGYLSADQRDRSRVKLVLAGEASRMEPGEANFQVLLRNTDGTKIGTTEQPLGEADEAGMLPFSTEFSIPQGSYIARVAVIDSAGHVGSVDHRVEARPMAVGAVSATGPVLVRVPSSKEQQPRVALDSVRQDDRLALQVDLEGEASSLSGTNVEFAIVAKPDGPPLVRSVAMLSTGPRDGVAVAQAVADVRFLPPGTYFARARITSPDRPAGELRRAFTVVAPASPAAGSGAPTGTVRSGAGAFSARAVRAVRPFALEQVLAPGVRNQFIDHVAARPDAASPEVQDLLTRAREDSIDALAVPADLVAKEPPAAFVSGLALLAQHNLEGAANAFRTAMRASTDFYPAMVYLGACYAAGGKDREASAVWRTALIREGDAPALHNLLADSLLREGVGDQALQTVTRARERWPDDIALKRTFAVAALTEGQYVKGLTALDELIEAKADDESILLFGLYVLYEGVSNNRPVEDADTDRVRMTRLAEAYKARGGASQALVDMWLAAAVKK